MHSDRWSRYQQLSLVEKRSCFDVYAVITSRTTVRPHFEPITTKRSVFIDKPIIEDVIDVILYAGDDEGDEEKSADASDSSAALHC